VSVGVQNLEKNYRDFQFRVTHLDPIIAPEMHQQEKSRAAAPMQKELMSDLGNGLCLDSENWLSAYNIVTLLIVATLREN